MLIPAQATAEARQEPFGEEAVTSFVEILTDQVRDFLNDHRRYLLDELEHERAARQEADELAKLYESELNELRGKLRALAG